MSIEDRAQELELQEWQRNNAPRPVRPLLTAAEKGYGPAECIECGDEMPELRRAMGCEMCTDCTALEDRKRERGLA